MIKGDIKMFVETSDSKVGDRKGIEVINNGSYYASKIVLVVDGKEYEVDGKELYRAIQNAMGR